MKKTLADSPVLKLTEAQIWLAEKSPIGFLVALWLDPETASKLALAGGEPPEALHITLAFCGDVADMGELLQAQAITAVNDAVRYWNPIEGTVAGYGRFDASESNEGQDVFYATPDISNLIDLRQCIVNCLLDEGVAVSTNHGYTPHITLAYVDSGAPNPVDSVEAVELKFTGVTIMAGSRRIEIPFWSETYPESTISMSEEGTLPLEAPLDAQPARALYFGSFDKEWIPFLPIPGKYVHGTYGDMNLTPETYSEMLLNFNNNVFKQDLPIRATHTPADGGAIGWIKPGGMRLADDGSLEVKPKWNELGQGLVDDDRFRYVSAEYCKEWTDPVSLKKIPNVAVGLALVTRPHFKTDVLKPLSASEALAFQEAIASGVVNDGETRIVIEHSESGTAGEGTQMTDEEKAAAKLAEDQAASIAAVAAATKLAQDQAIGTASAVVTPPAKIETPIAPAVSLNDLTQVVITAEQRVAERQMFADLNSRVELAERRATTAEAKMASMEKERRVEKFTAEVTGRSAENGTPWFGHIPDNVNHLVSLAESHGDESAEVRWAVTQKRNEAKAIHKSGLFDPISLGAGEDGTSMTAQVSHLAEQIRLRDQTLTEEQSLSRVYDENPELYLRSLKR